MHKAIAITFAAVLLTVAVAAYSQDREGAGPPVEFKKGTVLSVITHTSAGTAAYIEDPIVKKLGETWFIVGTGPDVQGFPNIGKRIWISLNAASIINEYKNVDEIRRALDIPQNPAT